MNRFLALLVALVLLPAFPALASSIELGSMTADELCNVIDEARIRLHDLAVENPDNKVLVDTDDYSVMIRDSKLGSDGSLYIYPLIINKSQIEIDMYFDTATVNGWVVDHHRSDTETPANSKNKAGYLELDHVDKDADVASIEQVEEIRASLRVFSDDNKLNNYHSITMTYSEEDGLVVCPSSK